MSDNSITNSELKSDIGNRIRELRKKNHETQEDIGNFLGISRDAVSKLERGFNYVSIDNAIKIAKKYGVSLDYLLTGETMEYTRIDDATRAFETLCNFIKWRMLNLNMGYEHDLPTIAIDNNLLNFLKATFDMAHFDNEGRLPKNVIDSWLKDETKKMISIIRDTPKRDDSISWSVEGFTVYALLSNDKITDEVARIIEKNWP